MRVDDVTRVAVIGGGTMGNGIAHVFAQHGHDVVREIHRLESDLIRVYAVLDCRRDPAWTRDRLT